MSVSLGLFSSHPLAASILVLLLAMSLAITSYFASQRLKQKKPRLTVVLMMNTLAALMVAGLAFDVQIISKQISDIYLITQGTSNQQLEKINTQQPIFVLPGAAQSTNNSNILDAATEIEIPSQLLSKQASFNNMHVLGDGLSVSQWQSLQLLMGQEFDKISVTFSASKPRVGLVNMRWPRELVVGQFVEITGQLQGTENRLSVDDIYQLSVLDPAGNTLQTTRLKPSEGFSLSFPAKSIGQWVYRLQLSKPNNSEVLANEPVAFAVTHPDHLRILIKQSSPSFETRQLKNWATKFASQISVFTQISQNKEIQQNINVDPSSLKQITSPFIDNALDNIDWMVIDGRALLTLTKLQMSALQSAVKRGLGLYIIADNELVNAWPAPSLDWLYGLDIQPLDVANYSSTPSWPHSQIEQVMPLVKAKLISTNDRALVQNNLKQILVSHSQIGLGQVSVSLINSTYGWQTAGLTGQYSHYWQSVINKLARPKPPPYWLSSQLDSLTLISQPKQKCLLGVSGSGMTRHNQNSRSLILTQDIVENEQHCLTIWPARDGWHKLTWSEDTDSEHVNYAKQSSMDTWLYAYHEQDWSVWQQARNHQASQKMAQQLNTIRPGESKLKSLDKSGLWGMLILFISLLWLERKLF